ncbi:hypothetical protein NDU88_004329 [Pleurodeles waltl]|uniref:Secreted protein n=1 Tax=Pleurodeles waltl TaxID=8319 RepID=A0AAV7VJY7_PLEWA|nr:hypothetical protein NDU88_004329 [Pleurodeles waltl]
MLVPRTGVCAVSLQRLTGPLLGAPPSLRLGSYLRGRELAVGSEVVARGRTHQQPVRAWETKAGERRHPSDRECYAKEPPEPCPHLTVELPLARRRKTHGGGPVGRRGKYRPNTS